MTPNNTDEQIRHVFDEWHRAVKGQDAEGMAANDGVLETPAVLALWPEREDAVVHGRDVVAEQARDGNDSRLTERGRATRERILRAAADMMYVRGVSSTTLDEVRAASGTSKSQLYRHYPDKDALVRDVVALQAAELLEVQQHLLRLNSLRGLERWRDVLIEHNALRNGAYGCPLGSLASELADQNDEVRKAIARHFDTWVGLLEAGLVRMKDSGVLRADANAGELATGLMAALQGGYLLAQTAQDVKPMRIALNMAISHVKALAVLAEDGNPPEGGAGGR